MPTKKTETPETVETEQGPATEDSDSPPATGDTDTATETDTLKTCQHTYKTIRPLGESDIKARRNARCTKCKAPAWINGL